MTVVRGGDVPVEETPWGSLQWLVTAKNASERLTVGRVTFKPGCSNPAHFHPNCEEALYVLKGRIEHTLPGGGTTVLEPGDVIVMPKDEKHFAKNVGDEEAVVLVSFNSGRRETIGEDVAPGALDS